MKRSVLALAVVIFVAAIATVGSADAARAYSNCSALNRDYPHGVGKLSARDHTSGTPVTNFTRSLKLYNANSSKDRDRDGIACEKK